MIVTLDSRRRLTLLWDDGFMIVFWFKMRVFWRNRQTNGLH